MSHQVSNWDELLLFCSQAQFPEHHLVIKPDDEHHVECRKGIDHYDSLKEAFEWARELSQHGIVFVEHDLRAHANPTRMGHILKATQVLAQKMNSLCPECNTPGFAVTKVEPGLPCSSCGMATRLPQAHVWSCVKCNHTQSNYIEYVTAADPSRCDFCNP